MWRFILNDNTVALDAGAHRVALDFLRGDLGLKGTKEACREGDCGACAVLLGELEGGRIRYRAVCSCLLPLGDVAGRHLVTIEGLCGPDLSPVQRAFVDGGGVQCGFCTPGLVVALTGFLLESPSLDPDGALLGLAGNLCRCTGYGGIRRAVALLAERLPDIGPVGPARVARLVELGVLPSYFTEVRSRIEALPAVEGGTGAARSTPEAWRGIAFGGGTDVFSQRKLALEGEPLRFLRREEALRGISRDGEVLDIGAATTAAELMESDVAAAAFPELCRHLGLFASPLVRNRATLGGNLVNASPIGDLSILLIALGARLVIEAGSRRREIPIESFHLGYKKLALDPGEIVARVRIPVPAAGSRSSFEKVSRRRLLDIAGVNSALAVTDEDGVISEARLSAGGVAPIPALLSRTSHLLVGLPVSDETVDRAVAESKAEIAPIDDVRGSAAYKRELLGRLVRAHFAKLYPERVSAVPGKEAP